MRETASRSLLSVRRCLTGWAVFVTRARTRPRGVALLLLGLIGLSGLIINLRPAQTAAATNSTINFQARLETSSGAIAPDGVYNVEFKLYNVSSSGTAEWTEDYLVGSSQGITVTNGYLTANLGSITAFPGTINWDQQQWLTMNIGGTSGSVVATATSTTGWDGEMSPRLALTGVPYAFRAGSLADPANSGSTLAWATQGSSHSILLPNEAGTLCIQGSSNCNFASATGSTNYIQNSTSPQSGANFNIGGSGTAATSFITPSLTSTGALSITSASGQNLSLSAPGTATASLDATTVTLGNSTATIISIGTNNAAHTIQIGNTGTTGTQAITIGGSGNTANTLTLEAGSGSTAILIGNDATTHGIKIGAGGTSTNVETITIGSTSSTSTTTLQAGTSGILLSPAGGSSNTGVKIQPATTDSTAAFVIQNQAGTNTLFNADTTNSKITLTSSQAFATLTVTNNTANTNNVIDVTANGLTSGFALNLSTSASFLSGNNGGLLSVTGNSALTTNGLVQIQANSLTSGVALSISKTGTTLSSGNLVNITANSETQLSGGLLQVQGNALTTGSAVLVKKALSTLTTGALLTLQANSETTSSCLSNLCGALLQIQANALTSGYGAYLTSTSSSFSSGGLLGVNANSATTATSGIVQLSATSQTTGVLLQLSGSTATTTGATLSVTSGRSVFTPTNTIASATGAVWDGLKVAATTATVTGTTAITTANGFNAVSIYQPTITDSSAVTITNAATLFVAGAPTAGGSVTITNSAGIWNNGFTRTGLVASGGAGAVCSSLGAGNTPSNGTSYLLEDCSSAPTADYAENYPVAGGIGYGDVVAIGTQSVDTYATDSGGNTDWTTVKGRIKQLVKSSVPYQADIIGVVSDNHGDFTSAGYNIKQADNPMPVALNGRVPVNVTTENGPIEPGDYLTASSTHPGYAMKATQAGYVLGRALDAYISSESGQVMVFVGNSYYPGPSPANYLQNGGNASLSSLFVSGTADFNTINVSGNANLTNLTVSGSTTLSNLTVTAPASFQNDITIGGHIITASGQPNVQVQIAAGQQAAVSVSGNDTTGTITITTGNNPSNGALANVVFSKLYGNAPHVVLSPSNDKASGLRYYKGTTTNNAFMFNVLDSPSANTTYQYDYFIAQ